MVRQFPFGQDFVVLRDAMNQLLEESFVPSRGSRSSAANGTMVRPLPLDVYATQDEAVIIAAVPGMSQQNLEVTIDQNVVTVSGTVPTAAESEPSPTRSPSRLVTVSRRRSRPAPRAGSSIGPVGYLALSGAP